MAADRAGAMTDDVVADAKGAVEKLEGDRASKELKLRIRGLELAAQAQADSVGTINVERLRFV